MIYVEILAAIFGFLSVYFYILRTHWSWPVGFVQVVLYIVVFYRAKLYADMLLHVVYSGLQLYGWWVWRQSRLAIDGVELTGKHSPDSELIVKRLGISAHVACCGAVIVMTLIYGSLLREFTDASAPLLDSLIVSLSLVAQMLLAWRYLENWCYWMVVDVLAVGVFAAQSLYPTSILYLVFLVMAILGYQSWSRAWRGHVQAEAFAK